MTLPRAFLPPTPSSPHLSEMAPLHPIPATAWLAGMQCRLPAARPLLNAFDPPYFWSCATGSTGLTTEVTCVGIKATARWALRLIST